MQRPQHKKCRILVVDDHADSTELMGLLIGSMGHEVAVAGTCAEALSFVQTSSFDVVLCDIGLPDGDGCDLLASMSAIRQIKSVALTGHAFPAELDRFRDAGFDVVLVKPVSLEQVKAAISEVSDGLCTDAPA